LHHKFSKKLRRVSTPSQLLIACFVARGGVQHQIHSKLQSHLRLVEIQFHVDY